MNTKSILNPIFQVKKAQMDSIRTFLSITLVAALLLVTITALSMAESKTVEVIQSPVESSFAENPELMIARRFGIASQGSLSANPELSLARRFSGATTVNREWVVNPELSYVRSHAEGQLQLARIKFLSANPELMSARRYSADLEAGTGLAVQASYPNLTYVRQYSESRLHAAQITTYSTNPELMFTHRYEASQSEK